MTPDLPHNFKVRGSEVCCWYIVIAWQCYIVIAWQCISSRKTLWVWHR